MCACACGVCVRDILSAVADVVVPTGAAPWRRMGTINTIPTTFVSFRFLLGERQRGTHSWPGLGGRQQGHQGQHDNLPSSRRNVNSKQSAILVETELQ